MQFNSSKQRKQFVFVPTGLCTGVLLMTGLSVFASAPVSAQSASTWNKRGVDAEAREDYDVAFEAFRQAYLKKPKDLRYKTRYERLKFEAANMHVDRGRILRQSGDIGGALTEFARALQIDPGNEAAAQELAAAQKSGGQPPAGGTSPLTTNTTPLVPQPGEQTPYQQQTQRDLLSLAAPIKLQPVNSDPQTLHMVEDTKVIYQAIGKFAGINVIFDPEYTSKRIPVDLTSVSLDDALRIVGVLSGTFWKPVTPNTIFVAANNRTKHTDLDELAVQTFYLTNVSQQNDANEILVALRNLLDPSVKVYLVASQNAIVLRATPDELLLAQKLINDLDRVRPEVVIDVAVLEVSRNLERNLGITLPTSFGITPQTSNYNSTTSSSSSTSSSSNGLTLNTLGNINATNFAVTVSGGTVNALLSDSDTRVLQNPRIRATDGQRSQVKIGSKIPVATGSYNAGVSTGVTSVGVQTQFTYLDVGVNIDLTPTVHYDREISLKVKVEISQQSGSETISGVTEPIISQRVADQVIQLKDGEPAILAGLLQKQDSKSISGTPGLGELPLLKYFFSSTDKVQSSDEIVFLIIPHIVREPVLSGSNTSPIDTGTGQDIQLRHAPAPAPSATDNLAGVTPNLQNQPSAAQAANVMARQMADAARPLPPGSLIGSTPTPAVGTMPAGGANPAVGGPAAPVSMTIAGNTQQQVGSTFQMAVMVNNAHDLYSVPINLQYDPKVLQLVDVGEGDVLEQGGQTVSLMHRVDDQGGVSIQMSRQVNQAGADGQGRLCTLTFKALAPGSSQITLTRVSANNSKMQPLPAVGNGTTIKVTP